MINYQDTPLYTASNYGFEYYLKQLLQAKGLKLADLIDNDFSKNDFKKSEIYKVNGIHQAMQVFIGARLSHITTLFEKRCKESDLAPNFVLSISGHLIF